MELWDSTGDVCGDGMFGVQLKRLGNLWGHHWYIVLVHIIIRNTRISWMMDPSIRILCSFLQRMFEWCLLGAFENIRASNARKR